MTDERRKRALTDGDIDALADAMEKRILGRFYLNVGKGILGFVWKAVLMILLILAAYGAGIKGVKW